MSDGTDKTRTRLRSARKSIAADSRALTSVLAKRPTGPGKRLPSASPAITRLREHLRGVRADVLRQTGGGTSGRQGRELTALALRRTDQSLAKLATASRTADQKAAAALLDDGIRLLDEAERASRKAGKALGSSWPL